MRVGDLITKLKDAAYPKYLFGIIDISVDGEHWIRTGLGSFYGIGYNYMCEENEIIDYKVVIENDEKVIYVNIKGA